MVYDIQLSKTVGTYSEGNLFVVYEIKRQVLDVSSCTHAGPSTYFPTAPSPTTTHLIVCIVCYDCGVSPYHQMSKPQNGVGAQDNKDAYRTDMDGQSVPLSPRQKNDKSQKDSAACRTPPVALA